MTSIGRNIREVRDLIARVSIDAGRPEESVTLVAVSKSFPAEAIEQAVTAGQSSFGENRVQEAESKIVPLRRQHRLEWHLIGHLQSNKAARAVELFDVIHSLDSVKLAERLNRACREVGKSLSVLIQVDLGHEPTKSGADPDQTREILAAAPHLDGIRINGLMTLPPFFDDPEEARPYFIELRKLRDELEREKPGCLGQGHLSMGMSHDFAVAIQEGATMVRIGTAIFGERTHV